MELEATSKTVHLGRFLEILNRNLERGKIRHALFDFDGTISLVREGWQQVTAPMMVEKLLEAGAQEPVEELELIVREFVTRLTGKQTIYQMIELADQIRRRGKEPRDPLSYKHEYLDRLEQRIKERIEGLNRGTVDPRSLLVPGSLEFLAALRERGVRLYLASGTDGPFVRREAKLLEVAGFFDGGIFGGRDDYKSFSKKQLIDRIFRDHGLRGPELVGVGDGYVEIENTKQVGGIAVGIPSFESNPHDFDDWKKQRLTQAGADILAPNFLEYKMLVKYLFDE